MCIGTDEHWLLAQRRHLFERMCVIPFCEVSGLEPLVLVFSVDARVFEDAAFRL